MAIHILPPVATDPAGFRAGCSCSWSVTGTYDAVSDARDWHWKLANRRPAPPEKAPRTLLPCGTNGAYQRHVNAGEPVDEACDDAHRAYRAAWNRAHPRRKTRRRPR